MSDIPWGEFIVCSHLHFIPGWCMRIFVWRCLCYWLMYFRFLSIRPCLLLIIEGNRLTCIYLVAYMSFRRVENASLFFLFIQLGGLYGVKYCECLYK